MSGTRIMVFSLKELIRTGIFALIGLILIIALIYLIIPKNNGGSSAQYLPGTYSAQIVLHQSPVDVFVTVNEKEILNVELGSMKTVQEAFYPLFKPTLAELSKQIVRYQTTKIAAEPNNAVTSRILLDAVASALEKADPRAAAVK